MKKMAPHRGSIEKEIALHCGSLVKEMASHRESLCEVSDALPWATCEVDGADLVLLVTLITVTHPSRAIKEQSLGRETTFHILTNN